MILKAYSWLFAQELFLLGLPGIKPWPTACKASAVPAASAIKIEDLSNPLFLIFLNFYIVFHRCCTILQTHK